MHITYLAELENELRLSVCVLFGFAGCLDCRLSSLSDTDVSGILHKTALNIKWPTLRAELYLGSLSKSRLYHSGVNPISIPMRLSVLVYGILYPRT